MATWSVKSSGWITTATLDNTPCTDGIDTIYVAQSVADIEEYTISINSATTIGNPTYWGSSGNAIGYPFMTYFDGNLYVLVADSPNYKVMRHDGGTSWTTVQTISNSFGTGWALMSDGSRIVAILYGTVNNLTWSSANGTSWSQGTIAADISVAIGLRPTRYQSSRCTIRPLMACLDTDWGGGAQRQSAWEHSGGTWTTKVSQSSPDFDFHIGDAIRNWQQNGSNWEYTSDYSTWSGYAVPSTNPTTYPLNGNDYTDSGIGFLAGTPSQIGFFDGDWSTIESLGANNDRAYTALVMNDNRCFIPSRRSGGTVWDLFERSDVLPGDPIGPV
ncbi:MAG: hypothetical protein GY796_31955, partial [Chloroflexi bacterium]|nr:hypothetical protein [Chloroflexota bacterium]